VTSLTRGPLSAGTYWRRRAALLLTVVVLAVAVVGTLRGGGDDGGDAADVTASTAGGTPTPAPTEQPTPSTPGDGGDGEAGGTQEPVDPTPTREPLAEPVGRCDDADVVVEPEVADAVAGSTVLLALGVRTEETEACTWRMSARHLAVTLTRDAEDQPEEVWSTRQCPGVVPQQDVVVRREVASTVTLAWDGRYSDRGCTVQRQLVEPGELTVAAATYGGQPTTADLELRSPAEAAEAEAAEGSRTDGRSGRAPTNRAGDAPDARPTDVPTGDPADVATAAPRTSPQT